MDRVHNLATEYSKKSQTLFLSCKIGAAALASVSGMFSLSGDMHELPWRLDTEQGGCKLADSAAGAWASRQARNGHLILSVVNETLSNLKRVRKGQLVRSDMSVSVHRILRVDEAERLIFVGACPVNIDALVAGVAYVPGASLVLSLKSLDLEALLSMRFFFARGKMLRCLQPWT